MKKALIITSINADTTTAFDKYARLLPKDFQFLVIGDKKSPSKFYVENCRFISYEQQLKLEFKVITNGRLTANSYSRKNIGYLLAMRDGASIIYETDDDNIPYKDFFAERGFTQQRNVLENNQYYNVYSYFSSEQIWPRGFPIILVKNKDFNGSKRTINRQIFTPILQGLSNENPDVDAVYRMVGTLPISFENKKSITLFDTYCPFNSQNTIFHERAFPLLYIPSFCTTRLCDIWRGFVGQRICFEYGWGINFFAPTNYQIRNEHDLIDDYKLEFGFADIPKLIDGLKSLSLSDNEQDIYENLFACYQFMAEMSFVGIEEPALVRDWIDDCQTNF